MVCSSRTWGTTYLNIKHLINVKLDPEILIEVILISTITKTYLNLNTQINDLIVGAVKHFQNGSIIPAESLLKKVLQIQGNNIPANEILGLIKASQGKNLEAITYLTKAIKLNPANPSAQYNLAKVLSEAGRDVEAITHHKKTIELAPKNIDGWINYGKSLINIYDLQEAFNVYQKALLINPHHPGALLNMGAIHKEIGDFQKAINFFDLALHINPNFPEALNNKGLLLGNLKRYDEALVCYEKLIKIKPDSDYAFGDQLHLKMKICNWSDFNQNKQKCINEIKNQKKIITPFSLLSITDDLKVHQQAAKIYSPQKKSNYFFHKIKNQNKSKKIVLGYFSADFHSHATAYLMADLFEQHDKNLFEVIAFSYGMSRDDPMSRRLKNAFDQFLEVKDKSNLQIAELARELKIDIAVDLKGFTQDGRSEIFAYGAAPVQINYLGYPGTLSSNYIDYIIADSILISEENKIYYSEKIIRLPNSYQPNDRRRAIVNRKFSRAELGLPKEAFVYCCFNNNYKILPVIFDLWMSLLKTVPGSVLWLLEDNSYAVENLKKEAKLNGVNPQRLIFAPRLPIHDHLARHQHADLFLDTFPYNAHTTSSDALWSGLPVLTLTGESFASRVGASLLNATNLSELVTYSTEEYFNLAVELAINRDRMQALQRRLRENFLNFPLFNTSLYTKHIEKAFTQIYKRYQAGLPPEHIYITN